MNFAAFDRLNFVTVNVRTYLWIYYRYAPEPLSTKRWQFNRGIHVRRTSEPILKLKEIKADDEKPVDSLDSLFSDLFTSWTFTRGTCVPLTEGKMSRGGEGTRLLWPQFINNWRLSLPFEVRKRAAASKQPELPINLSSKNRFGDDAICFATGSSHGQSFLFLLLLSSSTIRGLIEQKRRGGAPSSFVVVGGNRRRWKSNR